MFQFHVRGEDGQYSPQSDFTKSLSIRQVPCHCINSVSEIIYGRYFGIALNMFCPQAVSKNPPNLRIPRHGGKLHSKQGTKMGRVSEKDLFLIHFESGMAFLKLLNLLLQLCERKRDCPVQQFITNILQTEGSFYGFLFLNPKNIHSYPALICFRCSPFE